MQVEGGGMEGANRTPFVQTSYFLGENIKAQRGPGHVSNMARKQSLSWRPYFCLFLWAPHWDLMEWEV